MVECQNTDMYVSFQGHANPCIERVLLTLLINLLLEMALQQQSRSVSSINSFKSVIPGVKNSSPSNGYSSDGTGNRKAEGRGHGCVGRSLGRADIEDDSGG